MTEPGRKEKEEASEEALAKLRKEITEEIEEQLPEQFRLTVRRRGEDAGAERSLEIQDEEEAKRVIEAVLFASPKPVTLQELKRSLGGLSASEIEKIVRELKDEYESQGRSFRIQEIAGGFECATEAKYAPWITKLELQKKARQATQSALETLAILAYKQPITRVEIEDLRGVDVSGVLQTLMEKKLVKVVGKKEVPGRPFLYGTTEKFLEHFGLKSLEDLPNITQIRQMVEQSVKVENLLRTEKMISNEEPAPASEPSSEADMSETPVQNGTPPLDPSASVSPSPDVLPEPAVDTSGSSPEPAESQAEPKAEPNEADQKGNSCERQ